MKFSAQRAIVGSMFVAVVTVCLFPSPVLAQKKYKDPYHPKVEKIARRAVEFLERSSGSIPVNTIGALAVVEFYKRYDGEVPTDVRYIERTVKQVADMVDGRSNDIFDNKETYFPALAFILLAEYDAKQYEGQCNKILDVLLERQLDIGAFTYRDQQTGDTSQSQFGALAFYVARQHRFTFKPKSAQRLLDFFVDYQGQNGTWAYRPNSPNQTAPGTNSIHSASLSSVYLLADMLRLSKRVKKVASSSAENSLDLPKNVTVYIPPKDDEKAQIEDSWGNGIDPVVKYERGKLNTCKSGGNQWYSANFALPSNNWNAYFMYALERYAYFKEQSEGNVPGSLSRWYDEGVDHIESQQQENGSIDSERREATLLIEANTALYLLFLVRASEIISLPPVGGNLIGNKGFEAGELSQGKDGTVRSSAAEKSLQSLIDALSDDNLNNRQLQQITEAMKRAIREFKQSGDRSRGEVTAFLRTMISDKNYLRRLVAIKFLAAEQDMDNVPALLYAMGDPDPKIAIQAHNGLRLISRKIDTFVFQDRGNKEDNLLELSRLKLQWTKWFVEIRPDAELLE